ncbi:MAG TPA: ethanolamine ammonia-lyase reactivating factor EutA [Steroidobacteraceae bacterium]|jgi:ethanolamine utilization protein EutA|nr:ethanolamine ammonia-lyase reactivating factor EutA [Steroidobacteraceae bacterium]
MSGAGLACRAAEQELLMADHETAPKQPSHALEDHSFGRELTHSHLPGVEYDHDHDHDDFGSQGPIEQNPIWIQDHVTLTSVGIDIGSSGTQVIFSRLNLRRPGEDLTSRYVVTSREALFESPVTLTPYLDEQRIDQLALGAIIDDAYNSAGMGPDDVDVGSIILTGEALRRENAEAIAAIVAEHAGDFVCATAGHHMEAMLAAFGSGAVRVSAQTGKRLLNIDIGGGTTKLALIEAGRVVGTAAVHVGGRLQVVDARQRIVRLDPAGQRLAARAGFSWELGGVATPAELDALAESMAAAVLCAVRASDPPADVADLFLTERLGGLGALGGVMFSGGVAEYIYDRESRDFGDLGRRLGAVLRRRLQEGALPWPLLPADECIRATAVGASEYSVQVTGNTIYVSNRGALLPRRNIQVIKPPCELGEIIHPEGVATVIRRHLTLFDLDAQQQDFALAFRWTGDPSYERVAAFAHGIAAALSRRIELGRPLYIILDGDVAQTLGAVLRNELGIKSDVLVIDGIMLVDFDYVDLGRIRLPSHTLPVTVKSLLFNDMAGGRVPT